MGRDERVARAALRMRGAQENRLTAVEDFRERNCNVQAWIDVRQLATVALYAVEQGCDRTMSAVSRYCFEAVYNTIVRKDTDLIYTGTYEAIQAMVDLGFNLGQYKEGNRSRRKAFQTMADEEVFLERKMQGDPLKMKDVLTSRLGVYTPEAVDALVKRALSPERLEEARKMAESRPSDVDRPRTAAEQEAIDKAQMQAMKEALGKPPTLANDMPK